MKIKFTNFGRGSLIDERQAVPERFHRKPIALSILEVTLVLAAFIFVWGAVAFSEFRSLCTVLSVIAIAYFVTAYFLAVESFRFRGAAIFGVSASIIGALFLWYSRGLVQASYISGPLILWFVYAVFIDKASKQYYLWCRSVA